MPPMNARKETPMRRKTSVALGLVGMMALLVLALAAPVAAERGYLPDWRGDAAEGQTRADEARAAAESWLDDNGYSDLIVADLVEVDGRYYIVVEDAQGSGAFDLLSSQNGGWVHPAPTMMWNTSYDLMMTMMAAMPHETMMGTPGGHQHNQHGSMSGEMMHSRGMNSMMDPTSCQEMMGIAAADPLAEPLTLDQATATAQTWLDANQPGTTAVNPVGFPGYAMVHISDGSIVTGLLAIQSATGTIWPLGWQAR